MKKVILFIAAAIVFVGCKTNEQKNAEEYMLTNSAAVKALTIGSVLGADLDAKLSVSKWDNKAIDVITKADLAQSFLTYCNERAAYYKGQAEEYAQKAAIYDDDFYSRWADDFTQDYTKMKHRADSLQNIVNSPESKKPLYYVYKFTFKSNIKHPTTGKRVINEDICYAYINAETKECVKVDEESKDNYVRNLDNLK